MALSLKSGNSTDEATIDANKALYIRTRDSGGDDVNVGRLIRPRFTAAIEIATAPTAANAIMVMLHNASSAYTVILTQFHTTVRWFGGNASTVDILRLSRYSGAAPSAPSATAATPHNEDLTAPLAGTFYNSTAGATVSGTLSTAQGSIPVIRQVTEGADRFRANMNMRLGQNQGFALAVGGSAIGGSYTIGGYFQFEVVAV